MENFENAIHIVYLALELYSPSDNSNDKQTILSDVRNKVSCLDYEFARIRNRSIHRNTRNRRTEHRQSHIRDVAEDPN